ncbi:hypothetical protein LPE509_02322 [Legionella pneumophila subsp. pneumophila LPE509]|nr:hypothetical protein LPE509_02322 [Legionella pneumophila subsp. pneumophila LPE509]
MVLAQHELHVYRNESYSFFIPIKIFKFKEIPISDQKFD